MRADFIRMTSTTGGTSTLTCTAQTGYPLVSNVFTGTRLVDYSIAEYTDSTKVTLSKAETGIGSYNTSTEVLTRTKVLSTWSGSAYLPKFGTATAPSALNFGTTSANIDIMITPIAGHDVTAPPFISAAVASVNDGLGLLPLNTLGAGATGGATMGLTSGTVYYFPVLLGMTNPVSQMSIRTTSTLTGGSPTFDCAIYEFGTDGYPGKKLCQFTQLTGIGTTNTTYTSTALATPVPIPLGWSWMACLYVANSATGTFTPKASQIFLLAGVGGAIAANTNVLSALTLASQTVLNDPATAATGNNNQVPAGPMVFIK